MKILMYSSPYRYYYENIEPLAEHAEERGHTVYKRFSLVAEKNIKKITVDSGENIHDLIANRKIDCVVLVQPWWYGDKEIAGACNKYKVPFYIVDHAPPMMTYTEENGKKSHLYRANLFNARAFFAYGEATKHVMRKRGCKEKIVITGSPRIEAMLRSYKILKKEKDFKSFILYDTSHRMEDESLIKEFNRLRKQLGEDWNFFVKRHSRSPDYFSKIPGVGTLEGPEEQIVYFADAVGFTFPSSAMIFPALVNKDMYALYRKHSCREARGYCLKYIDSIPIRGGIRKADYGEFIKDNYHTAGSPTEEILKYIEKHS